METNRHEFDVAIVGGAFSGSATALVLLRDDPSLRVLIVERQAAFDRKVGESAVELSSWFLTRVLHLHRYLTVHQLPKYGQRFWFNNDKVASLADASELGNLYQSRVGSYHLDRAHLDEHVHGLAVESGAVAMRPARVVEVDLREGDLSTLRVEDGSGRHEFRARWIVDATGRKAWLGRKLGLVQSMPEHPIHAVWARYSGTRDFDGEWLRGRAGGLDSANCPRGLSTNHLTGPGFWVWAIPLAGGDVSVGVVWDDRLMSLPSGNSLAERFESFVRSFPAGRELMETAVRRDDDLHQLNNLPYRLRRIMGDGWAMVGDAAGFLDPFYSPGLDWASCTISTSTEIIRRSLAGKAIADDVASHNRDFVQAFQRWFTGIYLDKYYYIGDHELMEVALRMEVPGYYLGVVTPPYRMGRKGLNLPFAPPGGTPFWHVMKFVNRRLAGLARVRLAAGTYGRRNAGRRVLLPGFKLGNAGYKYLPGALTRLALLEARSIPDRFAARRRGAPAAARPTPNESLSHR